MKTLNFKKAVLCTLLAAGEIGTDSFLLQCARFFLMFCCGCTGVPSLTHTHTQAHFHLLASGKGCKIPGA